MKEDRIEAAALCMYRRRITAHDGHPIDWELEWENLSEDDRERIREEARAIVWAAVNTIE